MKSKLSNEPVGVAAAIQGLLISVMITLRAFDVWHPTEDQWNAVLGLYVAFVGVSAYFVRGKVSPTGKGQ